MSIDCINIATLPLDIAIADKAANLRAVAQAFEMLPKGTDIVVLPELFSTGFSSDEAQMRSLAERNTGATIDFLKALAAKYSTAIAGTYLAETAPHLYNRAFFIEPNGDETFYDKRHLFSLSSEANIFAAGNSIPKPIRFRRWEIAMIVCYDLRFPVWSRNTGNKYDLLLVPANWPQSRAYAWEHLLIARAIENQCAVVGADRGGSDEFGVYDGLSQIYDCKGLPVGKTIPNCPFIVARIDRRAQDEFRQKFPVSNDADKFEITL